MLNPSFEFFIWLSLIGVVFTFVSSADYGKCPPEGGCKSLSYDVACTFFKSCCSGLQDTCYSSNLSLDFHVKCQKPAPLKDDVCLRSKSGRFPSSFFGFQSEGQCVNSVDFCKDRNDSGAALNKETIKSASNNISWPSGDVLFRFPDRRVVTCSSNSREFDHVKLSPLVSSVDQTTLSSCRGHLLYKKEISFTLWSTDLEKSPPSDKSSMHVNISPSRLNWGKNYLYHSSVASLSLKNTCNESILEVYEPLSTDSQFYPINFSKVMLGPGKETSISFAYLPSSLGLSSAELVLQTSFGGFLVEVKGFAVESPHRLRPLVGLDPSSGGWLSRKVSLLNPFNETIGLEEVTALISVTERTGSVLVESICRKQNHGDFNKLSFSNVHNMANGESRKSDHIYMAVRPLNNWLISPHRTQSFLEMTFSSDSEPKVIGAVFMKLFRPMKAENSMLVVPFEAELKKTTNRKDTASSLSVSVEVVGPCDTTETSISIFVTNRAPHLLKLLKINEVNSKQVLQIKYLDGLLLFPGTVSQIALVTYESSNVEYDSFYEMRDVSMNCKLEILVNDSVSPLLELSCVDIFGICLRQLQESLSYMPDNLNPSIRAGSLFSTGKSLVLTKASMGIEADEFVREGRAQNTMNEHYLLNSHELHFPLVPIGKYYAKSITVRNPSQHPVTVQLILNSGGTVSNCKTCYCDQQSPSPSSSICQDFTSGMSMHGFSVADSSITEVFLHPHGIASLGPILFHPSNRCKWKSSAFIRSNLSGLELLSLQGFGGSLSLVMLEGSELIQRLDFNINLLFPLNKSNVEDASSACLRPLLKNIFAVNAGDFPVKVKRIDVSGRECGLDGFVVHNCRSFSLEPGESLELGLSYQSDFSMPLVRRELELNLGVGILVIPLQASIPLDTLHLCGKSIKWEIVGTSLFFLIVFVIATLLRSTACSDSKIRGEGKSIPVVRPEAESSSILFHNQGKGEATCRPTETGHSKQGLGAEHPDQSVYCQTAVNPSSNVVKEINFSPPFPSKQISVKNADKLEVTQPVRLTVKTRSGKRRRSRKRNTLIDVCSSQSGNSTPSSPLSPVTTLSPPETCSPCQDKMQSHASCNPEPVLVSSARYPENQNQNRNLISSSQQSSSSGLNKTGNRAMVLSSAIHPRPCNSLSGWEIAPDARAPGPKLQPHKPVQSEEKKRTEDRFVYDIWGNHFSGMHLCKPNSLSTINSGDVGQSNSFFLRGPQQNLMTNPQPPYVSSFCDQG